MQLSAVACLSISAKLEEVSHLPCTARLQAFTFADNIWNLLSPALSRALCGPAPANHLLSPWPWMQVALNTYMCNNVTDCRQLRFGSPMGRLTPSAWS